jgi:branched-chain amino acid transport system substrate-binding protein
MILFTAIDTVAKKGSDGSLTIDRMALNKALHATKDFKGMTGNITCDQYGDCADPHIAVYQTEEENVKKGEMPTKPFWKKY